MLLLFKVSHSNKRSGMSISHFIVKYGTTAKGFSAVKTYQNLVSSERVEYLEHQNYPSWAKSNPLEFWQASDKYEPAHETIYVQIESPLPRELSQQERLLLVKTFLAQKLTSHPYTLVILNSIALNGEDNHHFSLLFSERIIDKHERSQEQFFIPANTKFPQRGGAAKNQDWTHLPNIAALHDAWKISVRSAVEESCQKKHHIPQAQAAVQAITASTLYELVRTRKLELYKKLGELKEKRYQMGVRWTTNGFIFPPALTAPKAYEQALKNLGGLKYLETENRLQQAKRHLLHSKQKILQSCPTINLEPHTTLNLGIKSPTIQKYQEAAEQYEQAQTAFDDLRLSLEREPKKLQSLMNKLLWDDHKKHLQLKKLVTEINFLTNQVNAARKFQAELALLGEVIIVIRPTVNLLDVTRLIVDRSDYQAKLRSACSYKYLQSLPWKNYQLH